MTVERYEYTKSLNLFSGWHYCGEDRPFLKRFGSYVELCSFGVKNLFRIPGSVKKVTFVLSTRKPRGLGEDYYELGLENPGNSIWRITDVNPERSPWVYHIDRIISLHFPKSTRLYLWVEYYEETPQ
jgi:hypothetical protein